MDPSFLNPHLTTRAGAGALGLLAACLALVMPEAGGAADFCSAGQTDPVYLQVVLDRSGSMDFVRSATQRTRCEDSVLEVQARVKAFLNGCPAGSRASVLTFFSDSNDIVVLDTLIGFSSNEQSVLAALSTAPPCEGGTPLADGICRGIARLNAVGQLTREQKYLLVITDGGENRSVGTCSGPPSTEALPPYSPGSWQAKVYARAQTTTWFSSYYSLFNLIPPTSGRSETLVLRASPSDPPGSESVLKIASVQDLTFFEALADSTGGLALTTFDEGPRAQPLFGLFLDDFESGTTESWSAIVPGPDFTWSPQQPAPGETVTFTTNDPGPWNWIFPGGFPSESSEQNPQVFFGFVGEKAVSLTTSNKRQKIVNVIFE